MSDKYGYIGIETLLNFCSNQKDHCVTPNDFMRMNREKIDERPHGEWIPKAVHNCWTRFECSVCGYYHQPVHDFGESKPEFNFCPNCGSDNRPRKQGCCFASEECAKNPCEDCGLREGEAE